MTFAILDTSVMVASINRRDPAYAACRALLARGEFDLVIPVMCVAEVSHLVNRDLNPEAEATFIESLADLDVEYPESDDWNRIVALIRQYRDFPLGAVDASIVAAAERLEATTLLTLDHRHFRAVRPKHIEAFTLLPEL